MTWGIMKRYMLLFLKSNSSLVCLVEVCLCLYICAFLANTLIFVSSLFPPSLFVIWGADQLFCMFTNDKWRTLVFRGMKTNQVCYGFGGYQLRWLQAQGPAAEEIWDKPGLKNERSHMGRGGGGKELAALFSPACCCITMHNPKAHFMKMDLAVEKDISSLGAARKHFCVQ